MVSAPQVAVAVNAIANGSDAAGAPGVEPFRDGMTPAMSAVTSHMLACRPALMYHTQRALMDIVYLLAV